MSELAKKLLTRLKSFCWRALMIGAVAALDWILTNLGILNFPATVTLILGGILGEVSKWINNKIQARKGIR